MKEDSRSFRIQQFALHNFFPFLSVGVSIGSIFLMAFSSALIFGSVELVSAGKVLLLPAVYIRVFTPVVHEFPIQSILLLGICTFSVVFPSVSTQYKNVFKAQPKMIEAYLNRKIDIATELDVGVNLHHVKLSATLHLGSRTIRNLLSMDLIIGALAISMTLFFFGYYQVGGWLLGYSFIFTQIRILMVSGYFSKHCWMRRIRK